MLLAGDEFARTQGGNNNGYCQDSEISWIDWDMDEEGKSLLAFTRRLIALRREHIVFHRNRFFQARTIPGTDITDVTWLRPDGEAMAAQDWGDGHAKAIGAAAERRGRPDPSDRARRAGSRRHVPSARQRLARGRDLRAAGTRADRGLAICWSTLRWTRASASRTGSTPEARSRRRRESAPGAPQRRRVQGFCRRGICGPLPARG